VLQQQKPGWLTRLLLILIGTVDRSELSGQMSKILLTEPPVSLTSLSDLPELLLTVTAYLGLT
jgi:hypothetical protein